MLTNEDITDYQVFIFMDIIYIPTDWTYTIVSNYQTITSPDGSIQVFFNPATRITELSVSDPVQKYYVWNEQQFEEGIAWLNARGGGQLLVCAEIIFSKTHDVDIRYIKIIGYTVTATLVTNGFQLISSDFIYLQDITLQVEGTFPESSGASLTTPLNIRSKGNIYSKLQAKNVYFYMLKEGRNLLEIVTDGNDTPWIILEECTFQSLNYPSSQNGSPKIQIGGTAILNGLIVQVLSDKSRHVFQKQLTVSSLLFFNQSTTSEGLVLQSDGTANIIPDLTGRPPLNISDSRKAWFSGIYLQNASQGIGKQLVIDSVTGEIKTTPDVSTTEQALDEYVVCADGVTRQLYIRQFIGTMGDIPGNVMYLATGIYSIHSVEGGIDTGTYRYPFYYASIIGSQLTLNYLVNIGVDNTGLNMNYSAGGSISNATKYSAIIKYTKL